MSTENNTTAAKPEIGDLFAEYTASDDEITRLKNLLAEANKKRSDIVKRISDNHGKGPFTYKNKYIGTVVLRDDTYFFRGAKAGGIKID